MKKSLFLFFLMCFLIICSFGEEVFLGFLSFELPDDFMAAEPLVYSGVARKTGTLDPNSSEIGEGIYITASIEKDIGENYMPQWETEEAKALATREVITIDGLEAWRYTGYMTLEEAVWFTVVYFPLTELETQNEILFITMVNGPEEEKGIEIVNQLFDTIIIKHPSALNKTEASDAEIIYPEDEDGIYYPGETITLNFKINEKYIPLSPWICIVPSEIEHGSSDLNDEHDTDYAFLTYPSGSVYMYAPSEPGTYDFRINDSFFGGKELTFKSFIVKE